MKISIIGSLKPAPLYDEWEQYMLCRINNKGFSEFTITSSKSTLNSYMIQFCNAHGFNLNIAGLDTSLPEAEAKEERNVTLIDEADLVVMFINGKSDFKYIETETKSVSKPTDTDIIIVLNNKTFHTISTSMQNTDPIRKDRLISIDEELVLIANAQSGDIDALAQLISVNKHFVNTLAQKYIGNGLTLEQLIVEGNIGLEAAIKKFDASRGFKFWSYAPWWIRSSIEHALGVNFDDEAAAKYNLPAISINSHSVFSQRIEAQSKEDVQLIQAINNGDKAAEERLKKLYYRRIAKIALMDVPSENVSLNDRIDAGNSGLIVAASHYDEKCGKKFALFALPIIRTSIQSLVNE